MLQGAGQEAKESRQGEAKKLRGAAVGKGATRVEISDGESRNRLIEGFMHALLH